MSQRNLFPHPSSPPHTVLTQTRASVLFRFQTVFHIGELISNPLGGFLLSRGPWVALLTGNMIMVLALALMNIVPETLAVRRWHDARAGRRMSVISITGLGKKGGGGGARCGVP